MNKNFDLLIFNELKNVELTEQKIQALNFYCDFLIQENQKYNLTAIKEVKDIINKHFFDSLIFTNVFCLTNERICDVGTGAGFPGMIIKIIFPEVKITFIESNGKKIEFLKKVIEKLNLTGVEFVNERAEEYSIKNPELFDIVISRAMAPLNILLEVASNMIMIGGKFICLKSLNLDNELLDLNSKEIIMGLKLDSIQETNYPELGIRKNIFYTKINSSQKGYPRMYSQIKKKPLGK